jgi:hypothetical protein
MAASWRLVKRACHVRLVVPGLPSASAKATAPPRLAHGRCAMSCSGLTASPGRRPGLPYRRFHLAMGGATRLKTPATTGSFGCPIGRVPKLCGATTGFMTSWWCSATTMTRRAPVWEAPFFSTWPRHSSARPPAASRCATLTWWRCSPVADPKRISGSSADSLALPGPCCHKDKLQSPGRGRSPKIAVPSRTCVAPSAMAVSKSPLMPMESLAMPLRLAILSSSAK